MVTKKNQNCGFVLCTTPFHFCAVYHALYLEELTAAELIRKIACVCNLPLGTINQVYRQGPTGILILLSDQVYVHEQTHYTFRFTTENYKSYYFFLLAQCLDLVVDVVCVFYNRLHYCLVKKMH